MSGGSRSVRVTDPDGTLLGFVEVDRVVAGRCCGGIRAGPAVTAEEIRRIAAVMTLKCGFVGLAAGGAKGGVIMPNGLSATQRAARLAAFGRAAAPILRSGVWSHGADLGTTDADIARIRHAAGIGPDPGPPDAAPTASKGNTTSGQAAGLTVALCAEAALESLGMAVRDARVAIQGAGAVGRAAMQSLAGADARIVAISTIAGTLRNASGLDVEAVLEGLGRVGDKFAGGGEPADAVLSVDCDVMLLCAGSGALDSAAGEQLKARAVVCGANIPFANGIEDRLNARGVLVLPDFVAGGGGVLGSTLVAVAGVTPDEMEAVLRRRFKPQVVQVLAAASARGTTAAAEARRYALGVVAACEAAYGAMRPDTLLPEKLAPPDPAPVRLALALERRTRGSRRLAVIGRWLHGSAVARVERVLAASLAAGAGRSA
ncbi:MAG: Glu/Leu/Phe/Val dehydrogenase dimerization domain-containing protein [Steroidobacteraceae bacterium]